MIRLLRVSAAVVIFIAMACSGSPAATDSTASGDSGDLATNRSDTGVAGDRSTLVGVEPVAQAEEAEPTPEPVGGSSTSGRPASEFVFSNEVMDADDDTEVTVAPLGTLVRLDLGERMASPIQGDGLTVTFLEVLEDSRCPQDATCATTGEAKIKIHISWFGQNVGELTLSLEGGQVDPTIGTPGGGFFVALSALDPYPTSETAGSLDQDYVATVAVFKK